MTKGEFLANIYKVQGIPTTFFLDRNNGIFDSVVGGVNSEYLIERIEKLIKEK